MKKAGSRDYFHRGGTFLAGPVFLIAFLLLAAGPCPGPLRAQFPFRGPPPGASSQAGEIRSGELWPDDMGVPVNAHGGGLLFSGGTYYWFGEHKVAGKLGNTAQVGVHAYSSADLVHWKNEGIALQVVRNMTSDIALGSIIERPKVLFNPRTNKFVMWFHLELLGKGYDAARCGVAVADKPIGPYVYQRSFRPDAGAWPVNASPEDKLPGPGNALTRDFAGGQMARDLAVFADDDGKAYAIFSSENNKTLHVSQLNDDFTGTTGHYARIMPNGYNEAPVIFKHAAKYYLITSGTSGWAPNAARSYVADNILGPWHGLGNPCRGDERENKTTFESQGTFALPVAGKGSAVVFLADRWRPDNAIDGRYVWLPIGWEGDKPVLRWQAVWTPSALDSH